MVRFIAACIVAMAAADIIDPATHKGADNATLNTRGEGNYKVPAELSDDEVKAWVKNMTDQLFNKPLNQEEYNRRNWMWIRCRTRFSNRFDIGGTWFGPDGRDWLASLNELCFTDANYQFKYVNGQGWGDAMVQWQWTLPGCTQVYAVAAAARLAKRVGDRYKRNFYIWDCPGFEAFPHYGSERPSGKAWPFSGTAGAGPMAKDSWNQPTTPPANTGWKRWLNKVMWR